MSHIGETHGIYEIIDTLPDKDKYGHWIYKCECVKCGHVRFSHYGAIAGQKSVIRYCNHLRANGEPKPYIKGKMNAGSDVMPLIRCCENTELKMSLLLFANVSKIQIKQEEPLKHGLKFMVS